jgi:hypothetical protein
MHSGEQTGSVLLLGAFVQILSFDTASDFIDEHVVTNVAGVFLPERPFVYFAQDLMALISPGLYYNSTTTSFDAVSLILGFDISDDQTPAPRPFCFGQIPGGATFSKHFSSDFPGSENYIQYSADLYEGRLRVLTANNYVPWDDFSSESSTTTATISVLEVPSVTSDAGTEMLLIGEISLQLTSPDHAEFASFMENWGFVETNAGLSHVYDLSDPSAPKDVGGLETSSCSSSLIPIKIDGVLHLLGIGNVICGTHISLGLTIAVFDTSDPTNLQENSTCVEKGAWSESG